MTVNPRARNGRNAGARRGFKKMLEHARAKSVMTRKAKAVVRKLEESVMFLDLHAQPTHFQGIGAIIRKPKD